MTTCTLILLTGYVAEQARAILPYFHSTALLGRLIDRLSRPVEELRAEDCRQWVARIPNTIRIADVRPRERSRVAGIIQDIRIDPRERSGSVEATITDGTGHMIARWLGRATLSGIKPVPEW